MREIDLIVFTRQEYVFLLIAALVIILQLAVLYEVKKANKTNKETSKNLDLLTKNVNIIKMGGTAHLPDEDMK